jgi:hypothetical protein
MLVSCLVYSSILKMGTICSSETLVDVHQTTRRYIIEDKTLHNNRLKNQKSFFQMFSFGPKFVIYRFQPTKPVCPDVRLKKL